jgi:S-formylglutathione hydrolase FrmB
MTIANIQLQSRALGHSIDYTAILPEPDRVGSGPYSVLLQLHGMYDNHSAWVQKSRLAEYVRDLPLLVVMPTGNNNMWANLHAKLRYEDMVIQDLYEQVNSLFNTRKGKWVIGGLSMGGFGALRLGLKYPDKFSSVFAHSSVIPNADGLKKWGLPDKTILDDLDLFQLSSKLTAENFPVVSFDCGTFDSLIKDNREFHTHLQKLGLPHQYVEHPGKHDWKYWDKYVQEAIVQHSQVLGIKPVNIPE